MSDEGLSSMLDRLVVALAQQVAHSTPPVLTDGAAAALSEMSRDDTRLLYSTAGHLAHYDAQDTSLAVLASLISERQRDEAPPGTELLPGDRVVLAGDTPPSLAEYDASWLTSAEFVVRHVDRDGTLDIQPDWSEDYVVVTVPADRVARLSDVDRRADSPRLSAG